MLSLPLPHYILAGGKSRRFGSDKARHRIEGTPMLNLIAKRFEASATRTVVVARTDGDYHDLGLTTIGDVAPDQGPLGGILTALMHAKAANESQTTPWIMVTSCDLIGAGRKELAALMQAQPNHRMSVYRQQGLVQPFPGLYHHELIDPIETAIHHCRRSIQSLSKSLMEQVYAASPPDDVMPTWDMNRPGDPHP